MDRSELLGLLDGIKRLAVEAGAVILDCREREPDEPERKPDTSPVTIADREAHGLLERGLAALNNSIPLISEEDCPGGCVPTPAGPFWLVDPLDGTLGYLRRDGQFTVNIALVERGSVLAGVIHAPAGGEVYSAAVGCGSYRQRGGETLTLDNSLAAGPLTATVTNTNHSGRLALFLEANGVTSKIKCSSSLKICYVAERTADIYPRFGRTALWDTAAGAVIAREAGCVAADLHGNPLQYDPSRGIYHHGFMVYDPARLVPVIPPGLYP